MLLAGVARLTEHAGQARLLLTLTHGAGDQIKAMIANVRKGLDTVIATAPQLAKPQRWAALVRYIIAQIMAAAPKIYRRSSKILTIPPPSYRGLLRKIGLRRS